MMTRMLPMPLLCFFRLSVDSSCCFHDQFNMTLICMNEPPEFRVGAEFRGFLPVISLGFDRADRMKGTA